MIDTTPIARTDIAISPKNAAGHPLDSSGNVRYEGESGKDGESGGNITLNVCEFVLPRWSSAARFICRGSAGQAAESGGHKPYRQSSPDQPANGKNLAETVDLKKIEEKLAEKMPIAKRCDNWRWPGEVDWPGRVQWGNKPLVDEHLVHLRLCALDPDIASFDLNIMFFPSGRSEFLSRFLPAAGFAAREGIEQWQAVPQETINTRPGDGEDAYPGGSPAREAMGASSRPRCTAHLDALQRPRWTGRFTHCSDARQRARDAESCQPRHDGHRQEDCLRPENRSHCDG